jgi:porphobilinogen synthase
MQFPAYRPRRLRANPTIRSMMSETSLSASDLIYPLFVKPGTGLKDEIKSMPGQYQLSLDMLPAEIDELKALGIPAVILFGLPSAKDEAGSEAYDEHGIVQEAIRAIKAHDPDFYVITDVCMCEYTSHGHCGIIDDRGCVINDVTLELLAKEAVTHAEAGADMVAPSDMMDGRVAATRSSTRAATTAPSAMLPTPRRRSETASSTRWTPQMPRKAYARRPSTSTRAPTSSW